MINGTRYASAIAEQRFDAIVIGSGLGGLSCAALMAKAGKRVLVLERHYTAGGFTHAFRRRGYEWDVGVHYIGDVHKPHSPIRRVFDTITDGKLQWAKMDAVYDRIVIKDTYYDYHAGVANFREGLLQHFPHAGDDIDTYLQHIRRASRSVPAHFGQRLLPSLLQGAAGSAARYFAGDYFARTTHEVLKDCTSDRKLAAVLAGQWGDYGAPPKQSSFAMHALVAQHYLDGGNFPVGGASQIAKHIIPIIEASGGAVLVDAEVEEILVERGRAIGVRMHNGDALHCAQVISAAGVHTTFGKLLPVEIAQRAGMLDKVETLKRSVAHLALYVGLKGSREELGLEQANLWVYRDYDHDASLKRFLARPSLDFPLMYLSFPSTKDPAWAGNFPGKSTIDVIAPAPWTWFSRWQDRAWKKRGQDYDDFKAQLSERLLEEIYTQAPQTRGMVDYFELSTPLSTAHFSNYAAGELYGLAHSPHRFSQRWLTPRTPVKGLHLTGQDILFCGVGSALMSGVLTASTLLGPKLLRVLPDLFAGRSATMGNMLKTLVPKTPDAPPRPVVASAAEDAWFEAVCTEVQTLTDDSKAFRFACDAAAMRRYRPGQFVTVEAQIDGQRVCRSYTLSSTPTRPDDFEITIKRVAGGPFSNWICDTLKPGQRLRMSGPFGEFSCAPKPAKKILLLSAGSGITPMLSMARWIVDTQRDVDVAFVHVARRQNELIFGNELKKLSKQHAGTRVRIALSQEPAQSTWRGARGRLNAAMLRRAAPDLIAREVYLCGPEGFMASARAMLAKAGLPAVQLHEESFDVSAGVSGSGGSVVFADSGKSLDSDGSRSLLELAESAGIVIPSACRTGHCGECKIRCTAGEVAMHVTDGLSEDELAQGYVLTCVGAVNGDIRLAA
jgi:all-trans-retinol 13,14-reductase